MMKRGNEGLMAQGSFVKGITEETKAEDGEGKSVTGSTRIAIEEAREDLIVILLARNGTACTLFLFLHTRSGEDKDHTHFQNVGLNAMVRAESEFRRVSIVEELTTEGLWTHSRETFGRSL